MILVTGAAGKTGRAVLSALVARGRSVRALVHRPEQVPRVERLGVREVVVGDMRLPATLSEACQGIRAVYHICPNVNPDEIAMGQAAMAAARSAGVRRFVYHSVLHPQTEAMPHHWQKLRVEESLFQSGLSYTILQPAVYMQNVLAYRERIMREGVYPVPYPVETRLSMVDLEDVAAAAAIVLTDEGHTGATYEPSGAEMWSPAEMAVVLSRELGREVTAEAEPVEAWAARARAGGTDDYHVETLVQMFRYYERWGLVGNANVLTWLLGRPPTSFAAFVQRTFQAGRE